MSGPYDAYGGPQYNQPPNYNQYPIQGYPQQQPPYDQGYGQQNYPPPQQYSDQGFAPPARTNSYGPPSNGGFVQGIQGHQYGQYDNSNAQGHPGYYGSSSPQPGYNDAYAQNQAYQQSMQSGQSPYGATGGAQEHQFSPQSSDPNAPNYDPKAPPMTEGERGLLGSIGGGVAGHMLGKKAGHGFLGTVGGGILGSLAEDFLKDSKKKKHHHAGSHHHHSSHGGSSWGGRY